MRLVRSKCANWLYWLALRAIEVACANVQECPLGCTAQLGSRPVRESSAYDEAAPVLPRVSPLAAPDASLVGRRAGGSFSLLPLKDCRRARGGAVRPADWNLAGRGGAWSDPLVPPASPSPSPSTRRTRPVRPTPCIAAARGSKTVFRSGRRSAVGYGRRAAESGSPQAAGSVRLPRVYRRASRPLRVGQSGTRL